MSLPWASTPLSGARSVLRTRTSLTSCVGPALKVTRPDSTRASSTVMPFHGLTSKGLEIRAYGVSALPLRQAPWTTNRYVPVGVAVYAWPCGSTSGKRETKASNVAVHFHTWPPARYETGSGDG